MSDTPREFDITEFFSGKVLARGAFHDRSGVARRRFEVEMNGAFEAHAFMLNEDFVYDDGERQQRIWRIVPGKQGSFHATAADIIGAAVGTSIGNTIVMRYRHAIKIGGLPVVLTFSDRLTRLTGQAAVSRAFVTKLGFKIGEVVIDYARVPVSCDIHNGSLPEDLGTGAGCSGIALINAKYIQ